MKNDFIAEIVMCKKQKKKPEISFGSDISFNCGWPMYKPCVGGCTTFLFLFKWDKIVMFWDSLIRSKSQIK